MSQTDTQNRSSRADKFLTVGGDVNFLRQLSDIDFKTVLHIIQDLCICLI